MCVSAAPKGGEPDLKELVRVASLSLSVCASVCVFVRALVLSLSSQETKPLLTTSSQLTALAAMTVAPKRTASNGPLVFAVDHCFFIKGQGTLRKSNAGETAND